MLNEPFRGQQTFLDGDYEIPPGNGILLEMDEDRSAIAISSTAETFTIESDSSNSISGVLQLLGIDQDWVLKPLAVEVVVDTGFYFE